MKKILTANDVYKIYNAHGKYPFEALKNINFEMEKGDFVCVMGPSGAGKSTFVNTLSTIDMPTQGVVKVLDQDVKQLSENQIGVFRYENLGFIFQEFNLVDSLTVYENIALPLILLKKSQAEIEKTVKDNAKMIHVDEILDKFPSEISGGQRQRVAICRALVSKPELLIADEPTGNLDSLNSQEILSYLRSLNKKEGISILMVTHDSKIASYSDKFLFIKDGQIEEVLDKGKMNQKEYFYKIVEINNRESQKLVHNG